MNDISIHNPLRRLTSDQEAAVANLWQVERKSATQIVKILPEFGLTRNAICGLAWRRGWVGGGHVRRPQVKTRHAEQINRGESKGISHGVRKAEPSKPPPIEKPTRRSVFIADLEDRHCRWVMGDTKDFKYCGAQRAQRGGNFSPYCERHHAIVYLTQAQARANARHAARAKLEQRSVLRSS